MSDNNVSNKDRFGSVVMDSKHYEGFDMYNALELICYNLACFRVLVSDMFSFSDSYCVMYQRAIKAGEHPSDLAVLGHDTYTRSGMLLDYIVAIETLLKKFDITPA